MFARIFSTTELARFHNRSLMTLFSKEIYQLICEILYSLLNNPCQQPKAMLFHLSWEKKTGDGLVKSRHCMCFLRKMGIVQSWLYYLFWQNIRKKLENRRKLDTLCLLFYIEIRIKWCSYIKGNRLQAETCKPLHTIKSTAQK